MCDFASAFGRSVRQHTVRDKSKEETGQLPYHVSFTLQLRDPGIDVPTNLLAVRREHNSAQDLVQQQSHFVHCKVLFKANELVAIKHGRKKEQWGFFLVLLKKDLLIKRRVGREINFIENTMKILWLDNSETSNRFLFPEAYADEKNSPYKVHHCGQCPYRG